MVVAIFATTTLSSNSPVLNIFFKCLLIPDLSTQFRIWATQILKEYMKKGFVLDDERLKQGKTAFGKDYFKELLERVRSIRASERRIWQQITDIFAECSIDYAKDSEVAYHFFVTIQNKFIMQ